MSSEFGQLKKKLPPDWDILPFQEAVQDVTAGNPKIKQGEYQKRGALAIIDQGQDLIGGYTDEESLACKEMLPCILFGDHTKIFKFIEQPFALGADGVKILSPIGKFDKRFLFHYLNTLKLPGDAGYSRHYKFLKEKPVVKPPMAEQKRIAAILDKADAIRRKRQAAIKLADDFLRATFLDMFGDPVTNPKGWDTGLLGDFSEMETGFAFKSEEFQKKGTKLCRGANVLPGEIDWSDVKYWRKDEQIAAKYSLRDGDIVLAMDRPWISSGLKVARVNNKDLPSYLVQRVARLRGIKEISEEFIYFSIKHPFFTKHCMPKMTETTVPHISPRDIRSYQILLPNRVLVKQFSAISVKVMRTASTHLKHAQDCHMLFNSLTQRAFRGEL